MRKLGELGKSSHWRGSTEFGGSPGREGAKPIDVVINEILANENEYPHLADFLRSGGLLEIGESYEMGSFARLRIQRTTLNVVKMKYPDFASVLREMNTKFRQYIEENW